MSLILSIPVRLLVASLVVIALPACKSTDRSTERAAITCPPGMTRAAKQGICLHDSCGNGIVDTDEACDDGNTAPDDRCCSDCRSCPELAVLPVDEPEVPAEVQVAIEPAPCPPASPSPEATQAVASQDVTAAAQASSTPIHAHAVMRPVRPAIAPGPAVDRLAEQAHASMVEELTQARSTIAALEQSNAELRQSLDDQLQQIEAMEQRLRRGIALQ